MMRATDEEIREFFAETIFEGVYSTEIKSKHVDYYKGHIHSISINGVPNNVLGSHINVPISANDIIVGPCTFKCRLKEEFRPTPNQILFYLSPKSLRVSNNENASSDERKSERPCVYSGPSHRATPFASLSEVEKIKRRLRLENDQFIGQFAPQMSEGWYTITDIRNTDFTKIEDKERGVRNLSINFKCLNKTFNRFAYYKFSWVLLNLDPLKFGIDLREEITPVYPQDIVGSLYQGIMRYPAGAAKKISRSLDTLKKQLTQSGKEVFIYELLQNANDYPRKKRVEGGKTEAIPVEVEFHITPEYLIFEHTGEYFNAKNIAAICDINDGEKADNTEAIGYKGIGFKTVFLDSDYVLLKTGSFLFRFDKTATDVINTPWQILPVWTDTTEIKSHIKSVFNQHPDSEFRVKFALQPRDTEILTDETREDNYVDLFKNVFDSERVILFIPNIHKVSIFIDGEERPIVREKDNNEWCVSVSLEDNIPEEITEKINDVLNNPDSLRSDGYEKIPEKYINFKKTGVKFACRKDGRKLLPVDNAVLYCYLPAKRADWGFDFLMNTDMVPNGQRDDIEDIELNHVIARIAGRQFFYWIKQLIESMNYDFDSIFSLIPDFEECKKRHVYKTFIEEFQEEFEDLLKEVPFVPVIDKDGAYSYKCIDEIINDMSGLTSNNVIPDSVFIDLMDKTDYSLPVQELRKSESFKKFLYKHSPAELDIDVDDIIAKCENENFQKWLTDIDNNSKFIIHWLNRDELDKFAKKTIFIEYEGELFSADDLYYDFDTNCSGIEFLRCFIPHIHPETRKRLDNYDNWKQFVDDNNFKSFSASEMILRYVIDCDGAMKLLKIIDNSIAFFQYLAVNEIDLKSEQSKIPYFTEDEEAVLEYEQYLFIFSNEAYTLCHEPWLGDNVIHVLSHKYFDGINDEFVLTLNAFFARLGFIKYEKTSFIQTALVENEVFGRSVNKAIDGNFDTNTRFIKFLYDSEVSLKENSFKKFVLRCVDIHGKEVYLCGDDVRYFDQEAYANNSSYSDNTGHHWLKEGMMYALSNAYFGSFETEEKEKRESFLRQQFGVKTFTDKSFFNDVVLRNKTEIYGSLIDEKSIMEFLDYLARDADRIFDGSISYNQIKDIPLLCYNGTVELRDSKNTYLEYGEDAKVLIEKSWFSGNYVLLSSIYTAKFTKVVRQLFNVIKFDLKTICNDILSNVELKKLANTKEHSVDFWRWILNNRKDIDDYNLLPGYTLLNKGGILVTPSCLYIPDAYQKEKIESLVSRYVENAQFVSSQYLESDTDEEKTKWVKLFKKLGLKSDNKDILFSDILPNLASFEGFQADSVVAMMTKHLKDLKDDWEIRREQMIQLRVKTRSNDYKPLSEVLIANVDLNTISEPFKYISLSNEIAPDILEANRDILFLIAKEFNNISLISSKQSWIETKIKEYLHLFETNSDTISEIHVKFVRELAKLLEDYEIDKGLLSRVQYRTKKGRNDYLTAEKITLGSIYNPVCDFEVNGIIELSYLSEEYFFEGNKDSIKSFLKGLGMHHNMMREDLKFLSNRTFACYFWAKCFSRRLAEYNSWIEEGLFDGINCIPTRHAVRKADELYAPSVAGYAVKAHVPNWEEKVAAKEVVDSIDNLESRTVFEKLKFRTALSFDDCLYYLARVEHKRDDESIYRSCVINWLLTAPYNEDKVNEYRNTPTSVWRNGKGQKKHITELYAIHPNAEQQRSIFRGNEFVIQTGAFPKDADSFVKACQILKIQCLTSEDFVAKPINYTDETKELIAILRPRLLVLAAIENPDRFQELYTKYNEVLSKYHFCVCEKIDLGYDTIHNDVERIYNDDSHIYYVASWKHNRTFTKFCGRLKNLIDLKIYDDICEDVFDDTVTVEDCIEKYCSSLKYDEQFRSYMKSLDLSLNITPDVEDEPSEDNTPYYEEAKETEVDQSDEIDAEKQNLNRENLNEDGTKPEVTDKDANESDFRQGTTGISGIESEQTSPSEQVADNKEGECHGKVHSVQPKDEVHEPSGTESESLKNEEDEEYTNIVEDEHQIEDDELDEFVQEDDAIEDEGYEDSVEDSKGTSTEPYKRTHHQTGSTTQSDGHGYDPDYGDYMGSVDKDGDYQPVGEQPNKPRRVRKHLKNYTKPELERLRSHGTPLELESLPPTLDELDILAKCNITPEQIADTNYLAQLRLYQNLVDRGDDPEESLEEFVRNADDVTTHKLSGGKYIHTCSAARGVMYISPSVWNKMVDDEWEICVYLDGQGKNFHYIKTRDEFLQLVEKDDVVIKITGKEKVDVVNRLYSGILSDVKGAAYTLIRVAARTNMDAVFAHYVGAMAEADDGNDENEYGD